MIDRYTIHLSQSNLEKMSDAKVEGVYMPRYNAAPTQSMPVTVQSDPGKIHMMKWGFMSTWSNNKKLSPKLFNLPFNQATQKPSYRKMLTHRRCIIYVSGFYIWKPIAKKKLVPYYVYPSDHNLLCVAGLWEEKDEFVDHSSDSFTMLTRESSPVLAGYQEDMPFILTQKRQKKWLDADVSINEITGWGMDNSHPPLLIHAVSPQIANIGVDNQQLVAPSKPSDQFGNYTLFG